MEGQCSTCKYARNFDFGPSPSGPTDGVNCTNPEMAKLLDDGMEDGMYQLELKEYGNINLFRTESLGPNYERMMCPCWRMKTLMDIPRSFMSAYLDLAAGVVQLVTHRRS